MRPGKVVERGPLSVGTTTLWQFARRALSERGALGRPVGIAVADELAQRTLRWYVIAALIYRLLGSPIPLLGLASHIGLDHERRALAVWVVLALLNLALLVVVIRGPLPALFERRAFLAADLGVAVAANAFVTAGLARGTLYEDYRDVFWLYQMATIILWTGLRGVRFGSALLAAALPLQLLLARLNGIGPGSTNWSLFTARLLWIVLAMVVAWIIMGLSHEGARLAADEGLRAGKEAERARVLEAELRRERERVEQFRGLHDRVLQTLETIAQGMAVDAEAARSQAAREAVWLRRLIEGQLSGSPSSLVDALAAIVERQADHRLVVEFNTAAMDCELSETVVNAFAGAAEEALTNVRKHAGVLRAVVRAEAEESGVLVSILDQGRGFDLAQAAAARGVGLRQSITARMEQVGGTARVESTPGGGTYVELWGPR